MNKQVEQSLLVINNDKLGSTHTPRHRSSEGSGSSKGGGASAPLLCAETLRATLASAQSVNCHRKRPRYFIRHLHVRYTILKFKFQRDWLIFHNTATEHLCGLLASKFEKKILLMNYTSAY